MATPFERVKVAWNSPDREGALSRVVESMATEGVGRNELDNALGLLLDEIRSTGADDETEEIINSVGDRLHGWCHSSRQIKITTATLPTDEEVAKLPNWARVAFAARCTRRLLPLLGLAPAATGPRQQVIEVVNAVEQSAMQAEGEHLLELWGNALKASKQFRDLNLELQAAVASTAYRAALLAWGKGFMAAPIPNTFYKSLSPTAWSESVVIAQAIGSDIAGALRRDYQILLQAATEQGWNDSTPIPATFFVTPLWQSDLPSDWPQDAEGYASPRI